MVPLGIHTLDKYTFQHAMYTLYQMNDVGYHLANKTPRIISLKQFKIWFQIYIICWRYTFDKCVP